MGNDAINEAICAVGLGMGMFCLGMLLGVVVAAVHDAWKDRER